MMKAVVIFLLVVIGVVLGAVLPLPAASEVPYYSDRFVFLGNDVNDLVLVTLNFNRGKVGQKPYGEFSGAFFRKGRWTYLEGSDIYPYRAGDLQQIQPSYYARVVGSPTSGFKLHYDGGDQTMVLASGPIPPRYTHHGSKALRSSVGSGEALLTLSGKTYWGRMIHEPLVWMGFDGLKRYRGLFEAYHRFYLVGEGGREVYFYKNDFDRQAFLKKYPLAETLNAEGGFAISSEGAMNALPLPIALLTLQKARSIFALFSFPQRWEMRTPPLGTLYLWSRGHATQNWFSGGHYLMAIEGVFKKERGEARMWGMAEYIP